MPAPATAVYPFARVRVVVRQHTTAVAATLLTLSAVTTYAVASGAGDPAMVASRAGLRHQSPAVLKPGSSNLARALPSGVPAFAGSCNPSDPNWNNRDDDGDGVCNDVDICPFEFDPDQASTRFAGLVAGAACATQAITVPFQAAYPTAPHVTFSGAITTLKGIARYGGNQYRWDFGDGLTTAWNGISDSYNLGAQHVYTGSDGQLFMATLSVRNSADPSDVATAQYPVVIKDGGASLGSLTPAQTDVRAQLAVDEALWYQHRNLSRFTSADGAPGYRQPYAFGPSLTDTCAIVDAFASRGHRAAGDWRLASRSLRRGRAPWAELHARQHVHKRDWCGSGSFRHLQP